MLDARYKARLIAKCYKQVEGIDYNDIFSLVFKHTSIHVLLVLVVVKDLEFKQLNVKMTFLHGELEHQIYMKQSEGFMFEGKLKMTTFVY